MKIIRPKAKGCGTCLNQCTSDFQDPCRQCQIDHAAGLGWTFYQVNYQIKTDSNGKPVQVAVVLPQMPKRQINNLEALLGIPIAIVVSSKELVEVAHCRLLSD